MQAIIRNKITKRSKTKSEKHSRVTFTLKELPHNILIRLDLRKINVESTDPEMQARWSHIINPPLLKSFSTRADDAKTVSTR